MSLPSLTTAAKATKTSVPGQPNAATVEPQQERLERLDDDDVLSSIRTVRRMVEREFGQAQQRRKQKTSSDYKEKLRAEDSADEEKEDADTENDDDLVFWKSQCFRLKQELFEEKNQSKELVQKHKDDLVEASSKLKEALAEAADNREMKDTLVETLKAQTKYSEGLSKQLLESRKNSRALQDMWKDLVQTMEEEKESMDRERETSLRLLEETQQRLASALAERDRIEKEASERNEKLTKRVEELEGIEKSIILEQDTKNSEGTKESKQLEGLPLSCWNKSKIRSTLQQKLKELEESLEKDTETIRSLEQQTSAKSKDSKNATSLTKPNTKLSKESTMESHPAASLLATKKSQLRSKSLSVLEDVIRLQLQRLMEIHGQTTAVPPSMPTNSKNNDEEWKTILLKVSENRAKLFELRKYSIGETSDDKRASEGVTDKKKRAGTSGDQDNEGSPMKKSKTKD